ncbi:hypothetical protein BX600DRAFT_438302 [Xylariales sp. PMI_506]|nr:hypothetical protein BX600DRAFT_438302 [Xylariales sp. PMI_506]
MDVTETSYALSSWTEHLPRDLEDRDLGLSRLAVYPSDSFPLDGGSYAFSLTESTTAGDAVNGLWCPDDSLNGSVVFWQVFAEIRGSIQKNDAYRCDPQYASYDYLPQSPQPLEYSTQQRLQHTTASYQLNSTTQVKRDRSPTPLQSYSSPCCSSGHYYGQVSQGHSPDVDYYNGAGEFQEFDSPQYPHASGYHHPGHMGSPAAGAGAGAGVGAGTTGIPGDSAAAIGFWPVSDAMGFPHEGSLHSGGHKRSREKSRLAASRCREKSKKYIDNLCKRERKLATERATLQAAAAKLKEEVLSLKCEILKHGDCDCEIIQNYLVSAAKAVEAPKPCSC